MILGGTSSYIEVEFLEKRIKIQGELLMNGFLIYKNSIKKWEPPYENDLIEEETRNKIVAHILEESRKANFYIEID